MTAPSQCELAPSPAHAGRRAGGRIELAAVAVFVVLAPVAIVLIRRRLPWIPVPYLAALVVLPVTGWWITRRSGWSRRRRWPTVGIAGLSFVALLPVPMMRMRLDHPPGTAWRLDGRLAINGVTVDPPGVWYWLTAGRPPIVAEVVWGWFGDDETAPTNMAGGRRAHRPAVAEPAAAAVGLRRAGWPIDRSRDDLDVVVGGRLARTAPGAWFRQLALGPSHGLMVALMSYVYASGDDLGVGRAIAGTGKIGGDGEVGSIGGLLAKATAARRVGADLLLFPAGQRAALDGFEPGSMQLCPVATLDEAIDALSRRAACSR